LRVRNEYRWRTRDREALPRGETIKSVVSLALERVLAGERRWNPAQQPDFMKFMRDVIDSLINHLARSRDNALLTALPEEGGQDEISWRAESDNFRPGAEWLATRFGRSGPGVRASHNIVVAFALVDRPSVRRLGLGLPDAMGSGLMLGVGLTGAILLMFLTHWVGGPVPANPLFPNMHLAWQYMVWALVQEFMMQSFFFNRL